MLSFNTIFTTQQTTQEHTMSSQPKKKKRRLADETKTFNHNHTSSSYTTASSTPTTSTTSTSTNSFIPQPIDPNTTMDPEDEAFANSILISDTHAAIRFLLNEFPAQVGLSPFPIILKHQIYTIVTDRSIVEKELDALLQERIVRRFDSATGRGECFICMNDKYVQHFQNMSSTHQNQKNKKNKNEKNASTTSTALSKLIVQFCTLAITNRSVDITRMDLEERLNVSNKSELNALIRYLTGSGYLSMRTQRMQQECYIFSLPCVSLVKNILNGRKEMLAILKRKKFHELLQSKLLSLSLKKSCMRTRSVLRDLVGSDTVIKVNTTSGPLIRSRVSKKTNRK